MLFNRSLYLITDSQICAPRNVLDVVAQAIASGVTCVQLREKQTDVARIFTLGQALLKLLKPLDIPLIINDHVELAKLLDADGVHLGQNDMPCQQARQVLGNNKIIGLSIENIKQAKEMRVAHKNKDLSAVDYFGIGPIFATTTKPDAAPTLGLTVLKSIQQIINDTDMNKKPLVAIGGINHENAAEVLACGVDGLAVVSAIMAAPDPCFATKQLAQIINRRK